MGIGAAIIGSAVIGGVTSSRSARKQARVQRQGQDAAIAEQRAAREQARQDLSPYRALGDNALSQMQDPDAFETSPGYQWRRDEGIRGIENLFSGKSGGGNALRALNDWNQNNASNEFANWYNRRANEASMGLSAAGQTAHIGQSSANNVSNAMIGGAAQQAQAIGQRYSGINNAIQSGIGNMLYASNAGMLGGGGGGSYNYPDYKHLYPNPGQMGPPA